MNDSTRRTLAQRLSLFALVAPAIACSAAGPEDIGSTSQAICADPPCGPVVAPGPKVPPPVLDLYVDIPSATMGSVIGLALAGSNLSIDTTNTSPAVFGNEETISNPAYRQCEADMNACTTDYPVNERAGCYAEVKERCANVKPTITTKLLQHSYFTWGPTAKSRGAADIFFPLETLHHDGSVFSFDMDLHYVHVDLETDNVRGGFKTSSAGTPTAWVSVSKVTSASPTVILSADYIPNFDLTNMGATVSLTGLAPTTDLLRIDYAGIESVFDFNWNAIDIPDGFITTFYDLTALIRNRVNARIVKAFDNDPAHLAISNVLTDLFHQQITWSNKKAAKSISRVGIVGDALRVYYKPS